MKNPANLLAQSDTPIYLTVSAAARRLGCSRDTIHRRIVDGALAGFRIGGTGALRVKKDDVDALMVPVESVRDN